MSPPAAGRVGAGRPGRRRQARQRLAGRLRRPGRQPGAARHPGGRHLGAPGGLRPRRGRRRPEGAARRARPARSPRPGTRRCTSRAGMTAARRPRRRHQGRGRLAAAQPPQSGTRRPRWSPRCGSSAARAPSRRSAFIPATGAGRRAGHRRRQPRQGLHALPDRPGRGGQGQGHRVGGQPGAAPRSSRRTRSRRGTTLAVVPPSAGRRSRARTR